MAGSGGTLRIGVSLLAVGNMTGGGLSSYAHHVARALAKRTSERYTFFIPRRFAEQWSSLLEPGSAVVSRGPDPRRLAWRSLYEALILPRVAVPVRLLEIILRGD